MRFSKRVVAVAASVAAILGSGGAALAASGGSPAASKAATSTVISGCVDTLNSRVLVGVYTDPSNFPGCQAGQFATTWNSQGPAGLQGPAGPKGATGPQGPAGPAGQNSGSLPDSNVWQLPAPTALSAIGGPIQANGTALGTLTLPAGRYLISANAMFTRTAPDTDTTAASDTYPLITLWQGTTWASDFSNTVGTFSGGRMSQDTHIDTTASGSAVVVITPAEVSAGTNVLHFVGFAYDEDRGSEGAVQVDSASVAALQVGE